MLLRCFRCPLFVITHVLLLPSGTRSEDKAIVRREDTEWVEVSIPGVLRNDKPHILLIGDSIAGGYYHQVSAALSAEAYVARLCTSKSLGDPALLREISYVLDQADFTVIHFNNGLHGRDYPEEEYRLAFPELLVALRQGAPRAQLIWATTTPTREGQDFGTLTEFTQRVKERNNIAAALVKSAGITVNDLFSLVVDRKEYFKDGVHFTEAGNQQIAAQVAHKIRGVLLPSAPTPAKDPKE